MDNLDNPETSSESKKPNPPFYEPFKIIRPDLIHKMGYLIFILVGLVILFFRTFGLWAFVISPVFFVITPVFWNFTIKRFISKNIVPSLRIFRKKSQKKMLLEDQKSPSSSPNTMKLGIYWKILNILMGLKFSNKKQYYIEAKPQNIDFNKFSQVFGRTFNVMATSLALSSLVGMIYTFFQPISTVDDGIVLLKLMLIIVFISPLLSSWIIPTLWLLQDSGLKSFDNNHNSENVGNVVRAGSFRKVIGTGGLLLGFGFILDNIAIIQESAGIFGTVGIYIAAGLYLLILLTIIAFPSTLLSIIYFLKYHEQMVEDCRNRLMETIPIGQTKVDFQN